MDLVSPPADEQVKVHGVLVTYERPTELSQMLQALSAGTRSLDTLVVVDNSHSPIVPKMLRVAHKVEYRATGENLGPAGGIALGMEHVLAIAQDRDWVLVLDDDDPPSDRKDLEDLVSFGEQCSAVDPLTGAVGLVGGRFDHRRGEIRRPRDDELVGAVAVDYIGGGHMPLYRVAAIRSVGTPLAPLFFGCEELEYGLRLRRHGFHLYCDGELWRRGRERHERLGMASSLRSSRQSPATWRTYYSRRNLIFILRANGDRRAALRASAIAVGKPLLNLPVAPRASMHALRLGVRGVRDAWCSRLGRRLEPNLALSKRR